MWNNQITPNIDLIETYNSKIDLELVQDKIDLSLINNDLIDDKNLSLYFDATKQNLNYNTLSLTSLRRNYLSVTSSFTINDVGLTLIDYGQKNNLSGESLSFISGQSFSLFPVSGGSGHYGILLTSGTIGNYVDLFGGYFQNFFKLEDYPYQLLPLKNKAGWTIEMNVKKRSNNFNVQSNSNLIIANLSGLSQTIATLSWNGYQDKKIENADTNLIAFYSSLTINNSFEEINKNNSGFIYYIGTRAENKFNNYFLGETGLTTSTGVKLYENQENTISGITIDGLFKNDLLNRVSSTTLNAFGVRIKDDGKVGVRYVSAKTICESGLTIPHIFEQYTTGSVITNEKWTHITVVFTRNTVNLQTEAELFSGCTDSNFENKGLLSFFVDGIRVLDIKEFEDPIFKSLDDNKDKQQGVPYSLSWGGGSQGLFESLTFNGKDYEDQNLLIERWFNGSFSGAISMLRYYTRPLNFLEIRKNIRFENEDKNLNITLLEGGRIVRAPIIFRPVV